MLLSYCFSSDFIPLPNFSNSVKISFQMPVFFITHVSAAYDNIDRQLKIDRQYPLYIPSLIFWGTYPYSWTDYTHSLSSPLISSFSFSVLPRYLEFFTFFMVLRPNTNKTFLYFCISPSSVVILTFSFSTFSFLQPLLSLVLSSFLNNPLLHYLCISGTIP